MKPGYWKASNLLQDTFYHITEDEGRFKLEYINLNWTGGSRTGMFYLKETDRWVVPVESISEKEYFLAALKGGASM